MGERILSHRQLNVWRAAMDSAMEIFSLTKSFPPEERFGLVDQIRRSSRSVAGNISEAWRMRKYPAAFVAKLNNADAEACETQTWIEIALRCGYVTESQARSLDDGYERILKQLVVMQNNPGDWSIAPPAKSPL